MSAIAPGRDAPTRVGTGSRDRGTRARILRAADDLFYAEGARAIGVDRIAEAAGITKRTLYYHFRSKDDLLAACLAGHEDPTTSLCSRWLGDAACRTTRERVVGILEGIRTSASGPRWRGCGFLRVALELADLPGHPARAVAAAHKRRLQAWLATSLEADGLEEPEEAARALMIVLDGAIAQMLIQKDLRIVDAAIRLASLLLEPTQERPMSRAYRRKPATDAEGARPMVRISEAA